MTVRVVKEEGGEAEVVPLRFAPMEVQSEPQPTRSLPPTVHPEAAQVQAIAVLTALASALTPKLAVTIGVVLAAGLTLYAETPERNVLAVVAAGMFDGLVLALAITKGDWRR